MGKRGGCSRHKNTYAGPEVQYKTGDKLKVSRVKFKRENSKGDVIVDVCYTPPNKEEELNKTLFKQLIQASK